MSYNAAGVLSHIASDGPEAWTIRHPARDKVLAKMVEAIDRWPIDSERNINYRSFEPIIQLLRVYHTPECQHWSVWALANLTKVYRKLITNITITYIFFFRFFFTQKCQKLLGVGVILINFCPPLISIEGVLAVSFLLFQIKAITYMMTCVKIYYCFKKRNKKTF